MKTDFPGDKPGLLIWAGGFAPVGGIETFLADMSQAAAQTGVEVELLAWNRQSRLLENMRQAGVRVSSSPWRWGCQWALPDWLLMPFGLWKSRKARVIFFGKTLLPSMHNLINRFGRRRGSRQRFVYMTPYRPAELWPGFTSEAEKTKVKVMLGTFDLIICQDPVFAEDLRTLGYGGAIEVLPYLPPTVAENPAPYPKDELVIGFLGRLENQKNLPALLNIFAALRRDAGPGPALRLRLIGDGKQGLALKALAGELGIADVVDFLGALPRERIREAIQGCQLFCFTSHTEGQPVAALEILAEGRPIVSTAVGAFPNMISHPALGEVVAVGDTAAFLSALKNVLARQQEGLLCPQQTVDAYRGKFDRDQVLRKYMEVLSLDAPAQNGGAESLNVSVVITTRNRLSDLRRTWSALRELSPPPLEIIITADGCTDGTVEAVRTEMTGARLIVHEQSEGSIASRDRMIREARGEFIMVLDDDSYPQQADCVASILGLFAERPRMAVLHFPQRTDEYPRTLGQYDFGPARLTRSFSNAGAVLRRSTYLQLRGFEPFFFHAYEEPDYALQCVAAGWEIFFSPSVSIRHHYSSAARNEMRTHQRHARNEFWSVLLRCPFPMLLPLAAYRVFSQLRYAGRRGADWVVREPVWWAQAIAGIPRCLRRRQAVAWAGYRRWLALPEVSYPAVEAPVEPEAKVAAVESTP